MSAPCAMNQELNDVLSFLQSKHIKMSINNEWFRDCCDFYKSSNARGSLRELQNFVYEQWLLVDLRDVGEQHLPSHLSNSRICNLDGKYAVQVNEFMNIGESGYSQLKKIRNPEVVSSLCEDEEKTPAWQPKHSRCLKLSLTDGVTNLVGMEYESIAVLREPFLPGLKILLIGPIECRRGVLLLTSSCIEILGGETDSLLIRNHTENVLARKLNLEENPDPFNRASSQEAEDDVECIDLDSDAETDNHSVDSGFNSIDRRNPSTGGQRGTDRTDFRNSMDCSNTVTDNSNRMMSSHSSFPNFESSNATTAMYSRNLTDHRNPASNSSNWPPSSSSTIAARKENSPIVGVVTPIPANKRNAESPPPHSDAKSTKIDSPTIVPIRTVPDETPSVATVSVQELQNLASHRTPAYVKCVAIVNGMVHKPRIKNDKWRVVAAVQDKTGLCHVTFSDGFLKRKIFGISAVEIQAMKEKMATNSAVRDQVDDMIRNGVLKILALKGQFHVRIIADNELPVIVEVT